MAETVSPTDFAAAAQALAQATQAGRAVRFVGAATKLGWGGSGPREALRLSTAALTQTIAIRPEDGIATFAAGVPLARAQAELAEHGLTLALDPPAAVGGRETTLGGILATAESGPAAHRAGPASAQLLGATVALADGTIATTGPALIHGRGGYGLARLFVGSYGTLGLILAATLRVHALAEQPLTVLAVSDDADRLATAAGALAAAPLALDALDCAWRGGRGGLLAACSGPTAQADAEQVSALLRAHGGAEISVSTESQSLWQQQRLGQRSLQRALVRVQAPSTALADVLRATDHVDGLLVGRAARGTSYVTLNVNQIARLRVALPPAAVAVALDLPQLARGAVDVWPASDAPTVALWQALKTQFDPTATCNPGIFAAGI